MKKIMKKIMKKRKLLLLLILIYVIIILSSCGNKIRKGFIKDNLSNLTYYYDDDNIQVGWKQINNSWYYFYDGKCEAYTAYVPENGSMIQNAYIVKNDKMYFFDNDGKLLTNQYINAENGKIYALDENGVATETSKTIYKNDNFGIELQLDKFLPYVVIDKHTDYSDKLNISIIEVTEYFIPPYNVQLFIKGVVEYIHSTYKGNHSMIEPHIKFNVKNTDANGIAHNLSFPSHVDGEIDVGQKTYINWNIKYIPVNSGLVKGSFEYGW